MENKFSYDGNENGNYSLFYNEKEIGEMIVGEDVAIEITKHLNMDIKLHSPQSEIKIEVSSIGIILDVLNNEIIDTTYTYWFNDYHI